MASLRSCAWLEAHSPIGLPSCHTDFAIPVALFCTGPTAVAVGELIGMARHIGFERILSGGDLNVQLPEIHPHCGPQSCGMAS
eukprot:7091313-Pyramimonas_sp.AAC.1